MATLSGNQTIAQCWLINNSTAIQFRGESNDGHSTLSGVNADHNGNNLSLVNLSAGLQVVGGQFLCGLDGAPIAGGISIYNSRGVLFNGVQIGSNIVIDASDPYNTGVGNRSGINCATGCWFRTDYIGQAPPAAVNGGTIPNLKNIIVSSGSAAAYNN